MLPDLRPAPVVPPPLAQTTPRKLQECFRTVYSYLSWLSQPAFYKLQRCRKILAKRGGANLIARSEVFKSKEDVSNFSAEGIRAQYFSRESALYTQQ